MVQISKSDRLEAIKQRIVDEMQCPLKDAATKIVFGKGNPNADIVFIGEAPGEQEDKQGEPFVGRAGKELDKLLQKIGLTLNNCYIANILKYRPPHNRDPTSEEITRHSPYLVEQIITIQPRIIATLGNFSTKFVLAHFNVERMKTIAGITALHGKHKEQIINGMSFTVIPLFHPAAILYRPPWRAALEEDFEKMKPLLNAQKRVAQQTVGPF